MDEVIRLVYEECYERVYSILKKRFENNQSTCIVEKNPFTHVFVPTGESLEFYIIMKPRNGLKESLEEYSARLALPPSIVRTTWRAQGLNFLHKTKRPLEDWVKAGCGSHICRVMPGLAIPTNNPFQPSTN